MIDRIIQFSIRNKLIVGVFTLVLIGWGTFALTRLPIDAIPDITNNQIQIISQAPSLAVQEVESFITAPIEVAVANIPDIVELRSISRLGLSVVTIVFKDETDVYWARQQLSERLKEAEEAIPAGLAKIELAPVSTGLGEIYQYRLSVKQGYEHKYSPMELRTLQDWVVRRELLGTPGVADINSYGGFVRQYEIAVNPEMLRSMNITLSDIFEALERNNENTGSAYIDKKPNSYFIRGIGLIRNLEDVGSIMVKRNAGGIPVLIRDIARVQYGSAPRYGAFVVDTTEAVGGVVMMLKGGNARQVVENIETRLASVRKSLPAEVSIDPFLDRSHLVDRAIGTVSRNLIEGALIVIFILVLLLGNLRAGLIVASVIPLSMLFAIILMNLFGVSGNLMSLGAIDFGLIVDGAVIIVESVVHRIFMSKHHHQGINRLSQEEMDSHVLDASRKMMSSATFGQIIILIVYLPVMALVGVEGKMFRPMAQVVAFALLGAALLSLTYVPMASALFLSKNTRHKPGWSDQIMTRIQKLFLPVLDFALSHKKWVTLLAVSLFLGSLFLFTRLGGEFIPQLEEGDLAAGVMTLQGGSLSNTIEQVEKANKILLSNFPEVKHAVCKIGAGEIPTDPTPMETGDYIITLKDKSEWTSADTREELVAKMEEALIPLAGVKFEFQQPIQMRFNELLSGSKQDIAVKIFGDNLQTLAEKGAEIEKIVSGVAGVEDLNVEKVTGLAQVQVTYYRDRIAQYGLTIQEVNRALRTAFAGSEAGVVYDQEKRFGLVVRLDNDFRQSLDDVRNLPVAMPDGNQISLDQLADVKIQSGPAQVSREDTRRRITVGFNVRNRDMATVIREVSSKIDQKVTLPTGYYITYGGQFKNLEAARARLSVAVPVALLLILLLLYFTFRSTKQAFLILSAVPFAAIGGVLALWMRGMNFSISAGVGFIALFGVAVLNGIVLIAEFNRLEKEGITNLMERVHKGIRIRLRPVIMTAAVASLGFLPMALSNSAGAEVQKPLATVVIGGLISATLLTLILLPVFYVLQSSKKWKLSVRKARILPFILVLCCLGGKTNAQTGIIRLNQEQAVKMALDSNLNLHAESIRLEAARAIRGASWDIAKTEIGFEYGQMNSLSADNSYTLSQNFAFPGVYMKQRQLANAEMKSAELRKQEVQMEIATEVKRSYWQLIYLNARQRLLKSQDSLYARFAVAYSKMSESGETNKLEMINARSQSLEIKNQLEQLTYDLQIFTRRLKVLLNTSLSPMPEDSLLKRVNYAAWTDSSVALDNPTLAMKQQEIVISGIEKKLERNKLMPDFSVGYFNQSILGTQEVNGVSRVFGPGDRFSGVQAGISLPLWFLPQSARIRAASLKENLVRNESESLHQQMSEKYLSLQDACRKYSRGLDYYEQQALPEADLIIRQSVLSFQEGALDYADFAMSMNRAWSLRMDYLETLNQYNQTVIEIEALVGKIF